MPPLGGSPILWNEASPSDTDSAGAGAAEIRSDKTSIRNAVGSEHNWPSGGGAGTGYHLFGSARPFYDVQSNVSSAGTDGRIMVTSDTSNLFHVGSAGTMFLGGQRVLSVGSAPPGGQRFYWAQEFGIGQAGAGGGATITFPNSGFSGAPFVFTSVATVGSSRQTAFLQVDSVTPTAFTIYSFNTAGTAAGQVFFTWLSVGTRTF